MADDRTYIKLHDGMPGHPKVRGLSDKAFRAFVSALCYCSAYRTDGEVVTAVAKDFGPPKVWAELTAAGLAEVASAGYSMHDYLEHQRSAQAIEELKERRRAAGRLGGRPKGSGSKPKAKGSEDPKQNPKQTESKNNPETESLTNVRDQTETEPSLRSGSEPDGSLPNAGMIVKAWIDRQRRRPAERVIGQVAKQVRELLDQDFTASEIDGGLSAMDAKALHPSTLSSLVSAAANTNVRQLRGGMDEDMWRRTGGGTHAPDQPWNPVMM